jgi:hypothetical protein
MQLVFGIGALWGTRSDVTGIGPDQFAILQDNAIDFSFELKELYSQQQFPVDIARGKGKISGKSKFARILGSLYADLFFGTTIASGEDNVAEYEIHTLVTNLFTVAFATGYLADLGINYNTQSNLRFTSETGAPTAVRQYNAGAIGVGIYTCFSGDIGATITVSYLYTDANGLTFTISNNFMGYTPTFVGTFYTQRNTLSSTGQLTLRLNECVSSHFTIPNRIDDYAIPDFDFMAFAPGTGIIGTMSTSE